MMKTTLALAAGLLLLAMDGEPTGRNPVPFEETGTLVCLAEEMQTIHGVEIPPVHDHILGFRLDREARKGEPRYLTLLNTSLSKALFLDGRFREHTLRLSGRRFPGTAILEVTRFRWIRDGKLFDLYYWCEVCSIRGVDPGPCACCQAPVEFREAEVEE